ncbi:hypothetical protein SLE2022_397080 [Rubroshorea leprosula]
MAHMSWVSTQTLPNSSVLGRGKLTFPQRVEGEIDEHFPEELKGAGKAQVIMFSEDRDKGPFVVTLSLQKLGQERGNRHRVVLLERDWMPIVRALELRKGDTVSIFLLNKQPWTYLITVERAPGEANQPNQPLRMEFDLNEPVQMEIDLNEPVQLDMENNLNQPNQPPRMEFDLNKPVHPQSD